MFCENNHSRLYPAMMLIALLSAACGNRGDLYLPDEQNRKVTESGISQSQAAE